MKNVLICGANGKMGEKVYNAVCATEGLTVAAGIDVSDDCSKNFPIYSSFGKVKQKIDVIIDFSSPKLLPAILDFAVAQKCGAVLCTTGYNENDISLVRKAAEKTAVFRSANMSVGVSLLCDLCKKASAALENFDVEIIEKHHNEKKDAPSGTALMIADSIKQSRPEKYCIFGREGFVGARKPNEIGIHAVRGGDIVGEHEVLFAGKSEYLTLKHQATSRDVFASGAAKAALFLSFKKSGLFNMQDLINEL